MHLSVNQPGRRPRSTAINTPRLLRGRLRGRPLRFEELETRLLLDAADHIVTINTSLGSFQVELFDDITPATVANFLGYVDRGQYNDSFVHRVEPNFVVQLGGYSAANAPFNQTSAPQHINTDNNNDGQPDTVVNEFQNSNLRGTLAMAKQGGDPNSATSEWFINLGDNSANLDNQNGGFTVFGKVLGDGMSVVDAIAAVPRFNFGDPFAAFPLRNFNASATDITRDNLVLINSIEVTSSIEGTVFADVNASQAKDTSEQGLAGWTVYLDTNDNGALNDGERSTVTDANGHYIFSNTDNGNYVVRVVPQANWAQTFPVAAAPDFGARRLTVTTNQQVTGQDFGESLNLSPPAGPNLLDAFDTGDKNFDSLTKLPSLQFLIDGVQPGTTVSLYEGSTLLGSTVASGTSVIISNNVPFAEGGHNLVARQSAFGFISNASAQTSVIVDTRAPQVNSPAVTTANAGDPYSYQVTADDNGTFQLLTAPSGMTLDQQTNVISWTPTLAQVGFQNVVVSVTDLAGNTSQQSFQVAVDGPPQFPPIPDQKANQGQLFTFTPTVIDVDQLTYSLANAPPGAAIDERTGQFTWTPTAANAPGLYTVTVNVLDTHDNPASQTFNVLVNAPPVIAQIGDQSTDEGTPLSVPLSATDEGAVTFSLAGNVPAGAAIVGGAFTWTPSEAQGPGSYVITVRATDQDNLSAERSFQIIVNEVNQLPTLDKIADQRVNQGNTLSLKVNAHDADLPAQQLVFSLDPGAPAGVTIDPQTGQLTWAVPTQFPTGTLNVTVRVSEAGGGASVIETFGIEIVDDLSAFALFGTSLDFGGLAANGLLIPTLPATPAQLAQLQPLTPLPPGGLGGNGGLTTGAVDLLLGADTGIPHVQQEWDAEHGLLAGDSGSGAGTGGQGQPDEGPIQPAGAIEPLDGQGDGQRRSRGSGQPRNQDDNSEAKLPGRVPQGVLDALDAAQSRVPASNFWGNTAPRRKRARPIMPDLPAALPVSPEDVAARGLALDRAAATVGVLVPALVAHLPENARAKRRRLGYWLERPRA
ncbi:MAG: peptidylprolyl isomerase [Planctomycetia bacterium]|nr:peptidylprolyl isomerase [Planctomycetia bacterium]